MPPLIILAGGFGTRLRSAVADRPKALAPVGDTPFLALLLERWLAQGVTHFVFALHHQADLIRGFVESETRDGLLQAAQVTMVVEDEPLGTGGAVVNAMRVAGLEGAVLAANADTWLDGGVREMSKAAAPAISVVEVANVERFGAVVLVGDRIVGFVEKSSASGRGWINAGLYKLNSADFPAWNGAPFSIERELFPGLAASGRLRAVRVNGQFIDIGIPEDYSRFCELAGRQSLCRP